MNAGLSRQTLLSGQDQALKLSPNQLKLFFQLALQPARGKTNFFKSLIIG